MKFYSKPLPNQDDIVFVKIESFSENGIYCKLSEYDELEGMIQITEIARNRKDSKNAQKVFEIGKIYPVCVLKAEKNFIDLSYRKVEPSQRAKLLTNFQYIKKIIYLAEELIHLTKLSEKIVCEKVLWTTITKYEKVVGCSISESEQIQELYNDILGSPEYFVHGIAKSHKEESEIFTNSIRQRVKSSDIVIVRNFELMIFDPQSVDKLKFALTNNISKDVEIKYISSPNYQIYVSGYNNNALEENIKQTMIILEANCKNFKHKLVFEENNIVIKKKEYYLQTLNLNT